MARYIKIFDDKAVLEQTNSNRVVVLQHDPTVVSQLSVQVTESSRLEETPPKSQNLCFMQIDPHFTLSVRTVSIEGVFGIYHLMSGPFIALILESERKVRGLKDIDFRKIEKVAILPLFSTSRKLNAQQEKDEERYLQLLHTAITQHQFYFSPTCDVTQTFQRLAGMSATDLARPLWKRADPRFFWNRSLVKELIHAGANDWVVPVMSAYVDVRTALSAGGLSFTLIFISRRSRYRQGCRFTMRGIDDGGHVANFVETEQALVFDNGIKSSFVQVRGSIPLHWTSPVTMKYAPRVKINQSDTDKTKLAFQKHLDELMEDYPEVLFLNLIDKKKDQGKLGKEFQDLSERFSHQIEGKKDGSSLQFMWFDFHKECSKMRWHHLSRIFERKGDALAAHGWFQTNQAGEVVKHQTGVTRTNCMDNLDRTNVVQSVIARRALVNMLEAAGANKEALQNASSNVLETPFHEFEMVYKDVWGNNADAMSLLYSGTGALKTDFTRTGKRTFRGLLADGWNSTMRYYINNFLDGERQDGVDLMLGRFQPKVDAPTPFTVRAGQESLSSFMMKILVVGVLIFSTLSIAGPREYPLQVYSSISMAITLVIFFALMYMMVMKGHSLGERLVVHPRLCPEP